MEKVLPPDDALRADAASRGDEVGPSVRNRRLVAAWLLACCALVFAMVVLGGVTRLTGSGLSMVDWRPVTGVVPPIGEDAWEREFEAYRRSPEYRHVNYGMSLDEFKRIYWFEFAHRMLGRLIGVAFLVPFVLLLLAGRIERRLAPRLAVMFVLGGLQGLLGWYMVKSGLVDNPHVSQYRLVAHLALAVAIYAFMLWTALAILRGELAGSTLRPSRLSSAALVLAGAVFLTMLSGGFVAGLRAGLVYNTFPLMGGQWVPDGLWDMSPAIVNLFENVTTVQFLHRLLAVATFLAVLALWVAARKGPLTPGARFWRHATAAAAVAQVALGIATLLLRVPVPLAAAHQAGALLLLTAVLGFAFELRRPRA